MNDPNQPINLDEFQDPEDPPPGYKAIPCPDCSAHTLKPSHGTAKLGAAGGRGVSICQACRNRRWVWWLLSNVRRD